MNTEDWIDQLLREVQQKVTTRKPDEAIYRFVCGMPECPNRVRLYESDLADGTSLVDLSDPSCSGSPNVPHPQGWMVMGDIVSRRILGYFCPNHDWAEIEEFIKWLTEDV